MENIAVRMNARLARYTSWAAVFSGIASIIALVSVILFFSLESSTSSAQSPHFWGPVSDIAPIFQMLSLLIVALAFYFILRTKAPRFSLISCVIGVTGMVGVVLLQTLLRLNILTFEQEVTPLVFVTALVGVWLVMISILGQRQGILPTRLGWLGIATGVAFLLEPVMLSAAGGAVAWRVFMSNYVLMAGSAIVFLVSYVGFPVWAFWLGRLLLRTNGIGDSTISPNNAQSSGKQSNFN
jgi:hypothetical protein